MPHHVVQRGHNRQRIFRRDADYRWYLRSLRELAERFGVRVYAFCLMINHVHLVLDPGGSATNVPAVMKRLAGRHTRRSNRMSRRTGTLWEARYFSSPIEVDAYLLACCRYVELNPVRAGIVSRPEEYLWSSYRERAGLEDWNWLTPDPCYVGLGTSAEIRANAYRRWIEAGVGAEINTIRTAIKRGQLTGGPAFIDVVASEIGRRIELRGPGRPRRSPQREVGSVVSLRN